MAVLSKFYKVATVKNTTFAAVAVAVLWTLARKASANQRRRFLCLPFFLNTVNVYAGVATGERLGLDDIISVLQQSRLRWYGHVLRNEDNNWVKKYVEYEVEGARPRGRPKKTWREIEEKDCYACKLNREDVMDCNRWRKQIRDD